ncbi:helix-turn-helix domain-containing protein [Streptomyces ossamyceticus]|nr:helix-turn-helix domain-containing protein [Streptomyces ossamyceticus]
MGRRENPIGQCGKTLHSLAAWLRAGREAAGLSYTELAARTDFSADTLARAASGRSVPRNLKVVLAYASACGLSVKEAEKYWKLARRDEAQALMVLSGRRGGVHISLVKDFADLHSAMLELYQNAGCPPLRSLDARIGGLGRLPHSTAGRVLKGRSKPSRPFVQAFAEALSMRRSDLPEWGKAWDRADRARRSTRTRLRYTGQAGLLDRLTTHDRVTPRDLQLLMSDLESSARREPGIKLLVHIPEPHETEAYRAARMTRELLVDQAQRRGDLSCPECARPSFGYDDSQGWRASLCTECSSPSPFERAVSSQPPTDSRDTPTLSLKVSASVDRPRLPRRVPGRAWPRPAHGFTSVPQDAAGMETITESAQPESSRTPGAQPAGTAPDWRCRTCDGYHEADTPCQAPEPEGPDAGSTPAPPGGGPAAVDPTDRPTSAHRALGDFFAFGRSQHAARAPGHLPTAAGLPVRLRIAIPDGRPSPAAGRRAGPAQSTDWYAPRKPWDPDHLTAEDRQTHTSPEMTGPALPPP